MSQAKDQESDKNTAYEQRLRYTLLLIGLAIGLAVALWRIADIMLLIFAGLLFAILLRTLARPFTRYTPLSSGAALAVVIVSLVALFGVGNYFLAPKIAEQMSGLFEQIPQAAEQVREELSQYPWAQTLMERMPPNQGGGGSTSLLSRLTGTFSTTLNALTYIVFILFTSVFIASHPALYRAGFLKLVPPAKRSRANEVLNSVIDTLRDWLLGRFISMVVIGVVATVGLLIIGVPLAPSLGILTGILEFIPVVGPFLAAIPVILLAFSEGTSQMLWAIGLFVVIEQLEGNLIEPLVQQRTVALPPALTLTSVLIFGALFGFIGLLVASPLAAVILVLVRTLYIEDTLGDTPDLDT